MGLLRAHAALSSQEESLACMLGCGSGGSEGGASGVAVGAEGMRVALAARYHLASCLRCYLEAVEPWQVSVQVGAWADWLAGWTACAGLHLACTWLC